MLFFNSPIYLLALGKNLKNIKRNHLSMVLFMTKFITFYSCCLTSSYCLKNPITVLYLNCSTTVHVYVSCNCLPVHQIHTVHV